PTAVILTFNGTFPAMWVKDANVRSELIKNLEFGAELRFFGSRAGLDFTWYKSNATRQLLDIPMDPMSGYSARKVNAGNIQNKGVEIVADVRLLTASPRALGWTLTANFTKNENKIISVADHLGVTSYNLGAFDDLFITAASGGLYGDIYGTRFLRVKDDKDPNFGQMILTAEGLPQRDPEIVYLGNQQPEAMMGVTNSFSYRSFGLSFLVDARLGGKIFSASNVGLQLSGVAAVTAPGGERPEMVVDGVIIDGSGYAKNTVAVSQQLYWNRVGTLNNLGIGEFYTYDATNIRLRNVQLSYALPKGLLAGISVQNARVAVSCNNVWMIKSHLNGIDPESVFATGSNAVGFENGAFPTMRSFLFSLSIGF
ncbi:TonB-dependent receptor, partial [Agriterribacter sp.]|uniref:TonB-dependent receptor domain-containing protein n=1 Tax=Agriterribacter sp. TaxID=2821509 RepID=UPI002C665E9D